MLLAVLTSCSGERDLESTIQENVRETQTLVVYLMSEKPVSEKTASDIEDEINKLTKAKFKTALDLRFFTEDEYYDELVKKFKGKEAEIKKAEREQNEKRKKEKELRESCKAAGISYIPATTPAPDTAITEEATLVNQEYGTIEYVYPEPEENQLDIFYIGGYDKYREYLDEEWLAELGEDINSTSKKLQEHIPSIYMDNINLDGIYGVPNNNVIGEYTWLLLKKDLMEKYFFTEDSINNFTDDNFYKFLGDIKNFEEDVLPLKGKVEPTNVYYWTVDPETQKLTNQPSVLGCTYSIDYDKNIKNVGKLDIVSVFGDNGYRNQIIAAKKFEFAGYYGTEADQADENKVFAAQVLKGGYDVYAEYSEEYYVKMLARPRADLDDIFAHMYCVNQLEDNVARCMEIITYINTNETMRNLIQYGIEDENYYIDDDGVLHRYNDSYMLDVNKTGNIFMAHPEEGLPENFWEIGIQQNEDAYVLPTYGLVIDYDTTLDTKNPATFQKLYGEYMAKIDACKTIDELQKVIADAVQEISRREDFKFIRDTQYEPVDDDDPVPLAKVYVAWTIENGIYNPNES